MNIKNLKVPLFLVVGSLGAAAGSGGTLATASARQARVEERSLANEGRIVVLEKKATEDRERAIRMETILENVERSVEKIEKKLER